MFPRVSFIIYLSLILSACTSVGSRIYDPDIPEEERTTFITAKEDEDGNRLNTKIVDLSASIFGGTYDRYVVAPAPKSLMVECVTHYDNTKLHGKGTISGNFEPGKTYEVTCHREGINKFGVSYKEVDESEIDQRKNQSTNPSPLAPTGTNDIAVISKDGGRPSKWNPFPKRGLFTNIIDSKNKVRESAKFGAGTQGIYLSCYWGYPVRVFVNYDFEAGKTYEALCAERPDDTLYGVINEK